VPVEIANHLVRALLIQYVLYADEASVLQLEAFKHFWPWLEDALPSCGAIPPLARGHMITLADYGCSEGGNSANQFKLIKGALKKGGALEAVRALQSACSNTPVCFPALCSLEHAAVGAGARRRSDAGYSE